MDSFLGGSFGCCWAGYPSLAVCPVLFKPKKLVPGLGISRRGWPDKGTKGGGCWMARVDTRHFHIEQALNSVGQALDFGCQGLNLALKPVAFSHFGSRLLIRNVKY